MSGIVLTASVRQNLLSLQSTADLLATTQNRLATGKKVNTALDNPTNFFTAQGLDNRAGDINNLLDSIGNGVQVLQAANTGITSLQKLVDTAKSIANQVLQAPAGYTSKSTVTSAAALGGTAANLVDGATIKAGQTITVAANGALPAVTVTIGASELLDQLNTALAPANLTASLDSANKLVFTTANDFASSTIGAVTVGSTPGSATFGAAVAPVADASSQAIRANLVSQYNNIITQITTTAQDLSFNGINLLERRRSQADLQRNRQVDAQHQGRDLQRGGPRPCAADLGHRLPGQQRPRTPRWPRFPPPAPRFVPKPRRWVRTCRSCRSARTSTRT